MGDPRRAEPIRSPEGEMPFLDHLEELRRRILISLAAALLVGPLLVLYELSILLAALITRRRGPDPESGRMESVAAISLLLGIRLRRMAGPRLVRSAR